MEITFGTKGCFVFSPHKAHTLLPYYTVLKLKKSVSNEISFLLKKKKLMFLCRILVGLPPK